MGRKISDNCLKQGQGMRGSAVPPHPGICRVPPPPPPGMLYELSYQASQLGAHDPSKLTYS